MVEVLEPVNVWVLFTKNQVQPFAFSWHGRSIKVDKINLVHTTKSGSNVFYHFSISAGSNFYRLRFDTNSLKWLLEAAEEDLE